MGKGIRILLISLLAVVLIFSVAAGGWYWYDNNVDRSGWVDRDGALYYQDFHADPVSGWLDEPEGRYFLSEGLPQTGWQQLEDGTYYFDDGGLMVTGWEDLGSGTYFFEDSGRMHTGWLEDQEGVHYFGPDGALASGWLELEGRTYYLPQGVTVQGWQKIEDKTYFFDEHGILLTGSVRIGGKDYYLQPDGSLLSGWADTPQGRTYALPSGLQVYGWQEIDGKRYFFNDDFVAQTGWMQEGEYRYYFFEDGSAATGPAVIDGQQRYFSPQGMEVLLVNALNPIPDDYDPELISVTDSHQVAAPCYEALMQMLADCENAGVEYEFNSGYRTHAYQTAVLEGYTEGYMEKYGMEYEEARDKALTFVALPGTSEHQLGLAVDLIGDDAVEWFNAHCWDYGFIRRYPRDKVNITGIISEPWHFRYVGLEIAREIHDSGLCLEEYLGAEPVKG